MIEQIRVLVDLQYGSTGKGLIAGYLSETEGFDTVMTAWAPNAGHTYISKAGRKYIHTHLANGVVSPYLRRIMLGPGSLINPAQLHAEIEECADHLRNVDIMIHPHAAVVTDRHVQEEAGPMTKIGSTKKGVGAAMIQRIRRDPDDQNVASNFIDVLGPYVVTTEQYRDALGEARNILVEGAQGYGLSMYHGFYPFTTSRDVSVWQLMADVAIPYSMTVGTFKQDLIRVIGTARTYPIRVANRYDEQGTQVGYSGPCYDDQLEISFEDIGQKTELTTVTKLPRRIFTFSAKQIREAIRYNGVQDVFLNFVNYVRDERELISIVQSIEGAGARVNWVGCGPAFGDVKLTDMSTTTLRLNNIVKHWKECRNVAG